GLTWRTPVAEVEPGLLVTREIYVPAQGRGYARLLEKFHNITDNELEANPRFGSYLNYSQYGYRLESSSGDDVLDVQDSWFRLREDISEAENEPVLSMLHVLSDEDGRQQLDAEQVGNDGSYWNTGYRFAVPANEHRVVMHFITLENSQGRTDMQQVLSSLGEDVLRGISAEDRARIVNFTLCADADLDLLCDSSESILGTSSSSKDSDGDRFEDEVEVRLGSDPTSPLSMPAFDLYYLRGEEATRLIRRSGFEGADVELAQFDAGLGAVDF